jgi:hypothetical protein
MISFDVLTYKLIIFFSLEVPTKLLPVWAQRLVLIRRQIGYGWGPFCIPFAWCCFMTESEEAWSFHVNLNVWSWGYTCMTSCTDPCRKPQIPFARGPGPQTQTQRHDHFPTRITICLDVGGRSTVFFDTDWNVCMRTSVDRIKKTFPLEIFLVWFFHRLKGLFQKSFPDFGPKIAVELPLISHFFPPHRIPDPGHLGREPAHLSIAGATSDRRAFLGQISKLYVYLYVYIYDYIWIYEHRCKNMMYA